jgi:hypothetical protein
MEVVSPTHQFISKESLKKRLSRTKSFIDSLSHESVSGSAALPEWGSVKKYCTQPYDQGDEGSCTANAFCMAYKILCRGLKNSDVNFEPSRAYLHFKERLEELSPNADVVDGEHYVQLYGICSEESWPYVLENMNSVPPSLCDEEALEHKIKGYKQIPINSHLVANIEAMISSGVPVLITTNVYASFESDSTALSGVVRMPNPIHWNDSDDPCDAYMGGHEMCLVGYSHDKQLFTVINSWSSGFGAGGFVYIPYSYLSHPQLGLEFSVIEM